MMRVSLISCLAAFALAHSVDAAAWADDAKPILKKEDKLTQDDPKDKVLRDSYSKAYTIKFEEGKSYRIDMVSAQVDSLLRLENANGQQLALDDDFGGFPHARIIFQPKETGEYKIIATTFVKNTTGAFTLTVLRAGPVDLLELRAQNIAKASPAERNATINDLKKHFQELGGKLTSREAGLAMNVTRTLEMSAPKQAIQVYKDYGKLFAAAGDPKVAGIGRMFEGCARRIGLVGNTMEVKGTTLEGKEIDLAKMKGKVVLVDFWATWRGPCIGEIPAMKKMYETYHDRGFEILAVSVDQGKDAPTKFMEERKLPWPCIHDDRTSGKSLSDYYGVVAIPLPILVARDGKVVSLNARGPELERLLEQHIGPQEKK